jgi:hypothetical protein
MLGGNRIHQRKRDISEMYQSPSRQSPTAQKKETSFLSLLDSLPSASSFMVLGIVIVIVTMGVVLIMIDNEGKKIYYKTPTSRKHSSRTEQLLRDANSMKDDKTMDKADRGIRKISSTAPEQLKSNAETRPENIQNHRERTQYVHDYKDRVHAAWEERMKRLREKNDIHRQEREVEKSQEEVKKEPVQEVKEPEQQPVSETVHDSVQELKQEPNDLSSNENSVENLEHNAIAQEEIAPDLEQINTASQTNSEKDQSIESDLESLNKEISRLQKMSDDVKAKLEEAKQ